MSNRGGTAVGRGRGRASYSNKDVDMSNVTSHPILHQPVPTTSTYYKPESDASPVPSPKDRVSINSLTGTTPTLSQSRSLLNNPPESSASSPASFSVPPVSPTSRNPVNRASATPSISSLIDPHPAPPAPAPARPTGTKRTSAGVAVQNGGGRSSGPASANGGTKAAAAASSSINNNSTAQPARDSPPKSGKETTAPNSSAPSPKPVKEKVEKTIAPPIPRGNGLLSNDMFSNKSGGDDMPDIPNIVIHIPLMGETNKYVNFTKLAEEKYGWAALHPALARMKEAMGDASMSGDERDGDNSDSESAEDKMAVDSAPEAPAAKPPVRKRRRVADLYDSTDPFIDDTESMWEEHAAATKDGFFVYSGPLIREGEVAMVERADGTVKRGSGRGRGRGRGRGGATRGGGTGRGGTSGVPRKPRTVKPKKEKAEKAAEASTTPAIAAA